jgi:hypothetical protein
MSEVPSGADAASVAAAAGGGHSPPLRRGSFYDNGVLDLPIGLALSSSASFPRRHSISHVPVSRR